MGVFMFYVLAALAFFIVAGVIEWFVNLFMW